MKKTAAIFLVIIICINHLNILDTVMHFSAKYQKEHPKTVKSFPAGEESDSEKDCKGKEKAEEQEKYCTAHNYNTNNKHRLSAKDKFICFSTALNIHPFQDDDIQPPKAA